MLATWGRTDPGARLARACADGCDGATWAGPSRRSPWWPSSSPGRGWTAARGGAQRRSGAGRAHAARATPRAGREAAPPPAAPEPGERARRRGRSGDAARAARAAAGPMRRTAGGAAQGAPRRAALGARPCPAATRGAVAPPHAPPAVGPRADRRGAPGAAARGHGGPRRARVRLRAVADDINAARRGSAGGSCCVGAWSPLRPSTASNTRAAPRGVAALRALSPPPRPPAPSCGCPRSARRSSRPDRAT